MTICVCIIQAGKSYIKGRTERDLKFISKIQFFSILVIIFFHTVFYMLFACVIYFSGHLFIRKIIEWLYKNFVYTPFT